MIGEFLEKELYILSLQDELDRRTDVENKVIQLISECKFEEAIVLLSSI